MVYRLILRVGVVDEVNSINCNHKIGIILGIIMHTLTPINSRWYTIICYYQYLY